MAERDSRFAEAMRDADLAVPDGVSVVMASRVLDVPIPERVTGGDLMERMCAEAAHYGFRVFFLGGLPGAAVMAAHNLRTRYPGLEICGTWCPPPGFETDAAELDRIQKAIEDAAPDLAVRGLGRAKTGDLDAGESRTAQGGRHHGGGRGSRYPGRPAPPRAKMGAGKSRWSGFSGC